MPHLITTVFALDQTPTVWLGLDSVGLVGGVVSIRNGPLWTGSLQLPALSRVRRWNHQLPSAKVGLVVAVPDSSASLASSGAVAAFCVHSYENPSTPLPPASPAGDHVTSTVGSFDQTPTVWLELESVGLPGAVASIRNGPRCTAPLQLPALSRVRRWNHHSPSASGWL